MAYDQLNTITSGVLPSGVGAPTVEAGFNRACGPLFGFQPFGFLTGIQDGIAGHMAKMILHWVVEDIGTPTSPSLSLVAPSSTLPTLLRLNTGTANTSGAQAQSSNGTTSTKLARFFARAGNTIHFNSRFRLDASTTTGLLIGVAPAGTGVLGTNGSIGSTGGIFLSKAPGGTTLVGNVRRSGTSNIATTLATDFTADTFYDFGFRTDGITGGTWTLNGVETGFDFGGSVWDPNAALCLTIAAVNSTAAARLLDFASLCCFQEAH